MSFVVAAPEVVPPAATARNHKWCGVIAVGSGQLPGWFPKAAATNTCSTTGA